MFESFLFLFFFFSKKVTKGAARTKCLISSHFHFWIQPLVVIFISNESNFTLEWLNDLVNIRREFIILIGWSLVQQLQLNITPDPVVQRVFSNIHRNIRYPMDNLIAFYRYYPLDSDLLDGYLCIPFENKETGTRCNDFPIREVYLLVRNEYSFL